MTFLQELWRPAVLKCYLSKPQTQFTHRLVIKNPCIYLAVPSEPWLRNYGKTSNIWLKPTHGIEHFLFPLPLCVCARVRDIELNFNCPKNEEAFGLSRLIEWSQVPSRLSFGDVFIGLCLRTRPWRDLTVDEPKMPGLSMTNRNRLPCRPQTLQKY